MDSLASNYFMPFILQPTGITSRSKIVVDNMFPNFTSYKTISGHVTANISNNLSQFLFGANILPNPSVEKSLQKILVKT